MVNFGEILKTKSWWSNSVSRQVLRQKLVENAKNDKFNCDNLSNIQTMCMKQDDKKETF